MRFEFVENEMLTSMNSLSNEGVKFRKQASESRFVLSIWDPIHHNSFSLLNWNPSFPKITPAEHIHCGKRADLISEYGSQIVDQKISKELRKVENLKKPAAES